MDINLKQRLIGAVILALLAVIILPLLLSETKESGEIIAPQIPDPPDIRSSPVTVLEINTRMQEQARASEAELPREQIDDQDYREDFALDKNLLPLSWSLRVGSFQHKDNAVRLRAKLRAENYRVYIHHAKTTTSETWRVFVGPMVSRQALEKQAALLEANLGLKGQIVKYKIEEDAGQLGG